MKARPATSPMAATTRAGRSDPAGGSDRPFMEDGDDTLS
jgi:hypothetical protein